MTVLNTLRVVADGGLPDTVRLPCARVARGRKHSLEAADPLLRPRRRPDTPISYKTNQDEEEFDLPAHMEKSSSEGGGTAVEHDSGGDGRTGTPVGIGLVDVLVDPGGDE